jgi:hypothetical protein
LSIQYIEWAVTLTIWHIACTKMFLRIALVNGKKRFASRYQPSTACAVPGEFPVRLCWWFRLPHSAARTAAS